MGLIVLANQWYRTGWQGEYPSLSVAQTTSKEVETNRLSAEINTDNNAKENVLLSSELFVRQRHMR